MAHDAARVVPTGTAPGLAPGGTHFIGRLRVGLTALVITHHTAIVYGGSGSWFWRERQEDGSVSSIVLSLLCATDQAFFMGLFFLLAAYFTPASLQRHGPWRYLGGRLLRLGLPLALFGWVVGPMTLALAATARGQPFFATWGLLLQAGRFEPGPLWFCQALLMLALATVVWHRWVRPLRADDAVALAAPLPRPAAWWWAAAGVAAGALALRLVWPTGQTWAHLQLGYASSYLFLYGLGLAAAPGRWLQRLEAAQASRWARIARRVWPLLPLTGLAFGALQGVAVNFSGGLGLPAIVYALWEPLLAWGIIATLLVHGRQHWNTPSPRWQAAADNAYGAFVLHAPVLVAVSLLARPLALWPLAKWALVAAASVALSFTAAAALRRLPGVRRVL